MNTEQKCQYCPKCVPIRCRCMNRCEHPWKCIDANCTCHQSRHTEQKGWREEWRAHERGQNRPVFDEQFDFIERTLHEEREEMVKKIEGLVPKFWNTEEYERDTLLYATSEMKRQIIALIKDKI